MKRSEMLDEISSIVYGTMSHSLLSAEQAAKDILNLIEEKGMRPPLIKYVENGEKYAQFTWEKEDE